MITPTLMWLLSANICCSVFGGTSWYVTSISLICHSVITMYMANSRILITIMSFRLPLKNGFAPSNGVSFFKIFTNSLNAGTPLKFSGHLCLVSMSCMYHSLFCVHNTCISLKHLSDRQQFAFVWTILI